jgi:cobalt-zinc-cadmium efflux system outer membrane protein
LEEVDVMCARTHAAIVVLMIALAGCTAVDPTPRWHELEHVSAASTTAPLIWERDEADAQRIHAVVEELLADKLTRDEAVRIALLNNRSLQARFEEIGIAQADLVQAGLFTNPQLDVFLYFPLSLGNSAAAIAAMLSDLWTVPPRKRAAATRADAAVRRVATMVINTAAEAVLAYDEVLYRDASLALEERIQRVQADTVERVQARMQERKASELELHHVQTVQFDAEIAVARAQRDRTHARTRLDLVLGLAPSQRAYELADDLVEASAEPPWTLEDAVAFASEHRLDLAVAHLRVEQARQSVALERSKVFSNVALGPGYAGGLGTVDSGGPAIGIEVPLFDQNQAQIAKAKLRLRQSEKELAATQLHARQEVVDALAEIDYRREQIRIQRERVQPTTARTYESIQAAPHSLDLMDMLAMRAVQIAERRSFVDALWQLRQAEVGLHTALWGGGP